MHIQKTRYPLAMAYETKNYGGGGDNPPTMHDLKQILLSQGTAVQEFKDRYNKRLDELQACVDGMALKANRPNLFSGGGGSGDPGERKAIEQAVRALLAGDQAKAYGHFIEAKAMNAGTGPEGGYVVHSMISSGMTKVMEEISPVYRLSRRITLTQGDTFEEPIDRDSAEANWVGETNSRPDTDTPDLGMFLVPLHEIYAMPKLTQKLIDTASIDVVAWLSGKVGEAFAAKEGIAFHDGDGVAKPRGFLSYTAVTTADATRAWGQIQYIGTGASGAFPTSSTTVNPADVLVDVISAMKAQYRNGAVWLMNRTTAGVVRKLKDADGRHVWVDSLVQGQPSALLGYPVEIDEAMPDISAGSFSIAFVNLQKAYTVIEQPGVKFLADPYTDKPNVRLYNYRRVGGGMNNSEAIKLLKFS